MKGRGKALLLLAALAGLGPQGPGAASAQTDRVHVVRPGETLWQIAANLTGDPGRWPELYRANRDQIKDPSTLYPGQRLAIPDFSETPDTADAPPTPETRVGAGPAPGGAPPSGGP